MKWIGTEVEVALMHHYYGFLNTLLFRVAANFKTKKDMSKIETKDPKREKEEHIPGTSFGSFTFKHQVIDIQTLGCDTYNQQKANHPMAIFKSTVKRLWESTRVSIWQNTEKKAGWNETVENCHGLEFEKGDRSVKIEGCVWVSGESTMRNRKSKDNMKWF